MLKKSFAVLLIIAFLCGAVPLFDQEALAFNQECADARQRCADAIEACLLAAAVAWAEPTPIVKRLPSTCVFDQHKSVKRLMRFVAVADSAKLI